MAKRHTSHILHVRTYVYHKWKQIVGTPIKINIIPKMGPFQKESSLPMQVLQLVGELDVGVASKVQFKKKLQKLRFEYQSRRAASKNASSLPSSRQNFLILGCSRRMEGLRRGATYHNVGSVVDKGSRAYGFSV